MRIKRIITSGLIGGFTRFLIGSILYVSPWVPRLYQEYENLFAYGSMNYLGSTGTWPSFILIGDWLSAILMAILYSYTRKGLGKISKWKRGVFFGFLFWLVFNVPTSYHGWLLYDYPNMPDIIEILSGLMINIASSCTGNSI